MTRAGLEPATSGLRERRLIGVLTSLSIAKAICRRVFWVRRLSSSVRWNRRASS